MIQYIYMTYMIVCTVLNRFIPHAQESNISQLHFLDINISPHNVQISNKYQDQAWQVRKLEAGSPSVRLAALMAALSPFLDEPARAPYVT